MVTQAARATGEYTITGEESERIRILKIWLTVMVVFIHSYTEEVHFTGGDVVLQVPAWLNWMKYCVSQVISRCAVPGFFFRSGLFLYRRPFTWKDNMRKKVKTLLVPYLILNTFWIAFYYAARHIQAVSVYFSQQENIVASWTWREWLGAYTGIGRGEGSYPFLYPLWFMRDLMTLNLLATAIKYAVDRLPKTVFVLMAAAMALNVDFHIFCLHRDALVFFCLGYCFIRCDLHFSDVDRLDPRLLSGAYLVSVVLDCVLRDRPGQHLVHVCSIVLGFAFFARFTTRVKGVTWRKCLLFLAKYSLPVYLFHELNLTILKKLVTRFLPTDALFQALAYFGIPAVIITLCIVFSMLLERFLPRLYGVLTGGRKL